MLQTIRIGDLTALHAAPATPTGPPVLFVHGIFVDGREWSDWLTHFAALGFPAYALHLRGRAGSRPGIQLGNVSVDDFVDDATEAARFLGRPAVIGHSMGGLIAQRLAALDVVRSAVLVTPAPPRGIVLFTRELATKQMKYIPHILFNRVIVPDGEDLRELAMHRAPRDVQDHMISQLVPDSGRAGRQISVTGVPVDRSAIRCPMLVIGGEDDRFIPAPVVVKIAKRYGAELEIVRGHGHLVTVEPGWQSLADRVAAWVSAHA